MAIGNGELMYQCLPKHSHMGTATMKQDKEIDKDVKNTFGIYVIKQAMV